MKIAITVCRPWAIIHRFQSLLLNATEHDVLCIGPKPGARREQLTKELCAGAGVPLVHPPLAKERMYGLLDSFGPDVVYGEAINEPFEMWAQQWAGEHHKVGAVLDHTQFTGKPVSDMWLEYMKAIPNSVLMVTHKEREEECGKAVAVGAPELDLIHDCMPVLKTTHSKILALFVGLWWYDRRAMQDDERSLLKPLFEIAQGEGWQVYIHTHGGERVMSNSSGPEGLTFSQRYDYLLELQNWGGKFVGDYAGQIGYLDFLPINSYELMLSADCIIGTVLSPWWKACALRKKYIFMGTERTKHYFLKECGGYVMPMVNVETDDKFYALIRHTMKSNSIDVKVPQEFIDKYFMGLDGKCWERMLALC